jgi:hypothetical protein
VFDRWIAAINAPRDRSLLDAAVTANVVVERYTDAGKLAETFEGIDALERWLWRTPPNTVFSTVGDVVAGEVEYALDIDDFHNGGRWIATFAGDGRIATLSHRPRPLQG